MTMLETPGEVTNWLETCGHSNIIDQRNERPKAPRSHHTFQQYKPTNISRTDYLTLP